MELDLIRLCAGDFAACGRRASFWMPRKKPKRHQGEAQDERFALIFAPPLDPITGDAYLLNFAEFPARKI